MFKIGARFKVSLENGETRFGSVTKIKLIDDTIYYYDEVNKIWTTLDTDFYATDSNIYLIIEDTSNEVMGVFDSMPKAKEVSKSLKGTHLVEFELNKLKRG